jgi:hypothetical protein
MRQKFWEKCTENEDKYPPKSDCDHYGNLFGTEMLLRQLLGQLLRF